MEDHGCLKRAVWLLDGPTEEWGSMEGTVSWCSEEFLLSENEASVSSYVRSPSLCLLFSIAFGFFRYTVHVLTITNLVYQEITSHFVDWSSKGYSAGVLLIVQTSSCCSVWNEIRPITVYFPGHGSISIHLHDSLEAVCPKLSCLWLAACSSTFPIVTLGSHNRYKIDGKLG